MRPARLLAVCVILASLYGYQAARLEKSTAIRLRPFRPTNLRNLCGTPTNLRLQGGFGFGGGHRENDVTPQNTSGLTEGFFSPSAEICAAEMELDQAIADHDEDAMERALLRLRQLQPQNDMQNVSLDAAFIEMQKRGRYESDCVCNDNGRQQNLPKDNECPKPASLWRTLDKINAISNYSHKSLDDSWGTIADDQCTTCVRTCVAHVLESCADQLVERAHGYGITRGQRAC